MPWSSAHAPAWTRSSGHGLGLAYRAAVHHWTFRLTSDLTRAEDLGRFRKMVSVGAEAPDFTLPDQDGNEVTLCELRGRPVVLYFYPKADTPGCTTQACGIRDHRADYESAGATVVGVSPDTVPAQKRFAEKYDLDFTLLADADHEVAELYGTWGEKKMYGKTYMGVQRATFIIDPEGKVAHVIPKASPKTHDDVVLEALGELASA
jgi:peroxiredoxin Q/BCP